jgi:hypothetical protein
MTDDPDKGNIDVSYVLNEYQPLLSFKIDKAKYEEFKKVEMFSSGARKLKSIVNKMRVVKAMS